MGAVGGGDGFDRLFDDASASDGAGRLLFEDDEAAGCFP